jgi:hypothetical protein
MPSQRSFNQKENDMIYQTLVAFSLLFVAALAQAAPSDALVRFEKAYIPVGFDSNDNSQVVLVGTFPDTCHQVAESDFQIDESAKVITVWQHATVFSGNCLPVTVPFQSVITLGILGAGDYTIRDGVAHQALGRLPVTVAKDSGPGTDDYPYAPLSDAYVETDPFSGRSELVLQGTWTDRCTKFRRVDVHYYSEVIVVQPIVEHETEDGRGCGQGIFRFQKRVALRPMSARSYLLHVRSMAGNAINKIYYQ